MIEQLPPRVAKKIEIRDCGHDTPCWVWTAALNRSGYGAAYHTADGKVHRAHRLVYFLLIGDPGPELDHLCRNRACVNPAHLEPVTRSENNRRGLLGRGLNGQAAKTYCPRGHRYDKSIARAGHPGQRKRICLECRAAAQRRYLARRGG